MEVAPVGFVSRFWLAWIASFRILFSGAYAGRVRSLDVTSPREELSEPPPNALPPASSAPPAPPDRELIEAAEMRGREAGRAEAAAARIDGAAILLSLLQADGRLVDFLKQEISTFDDSDIGAAARVVHEGCNKALKGRIEVRPIFSEPEGTKVKLDGKVTSEYKLTGAVKEGTKGGTLKHKGWAVASVKLPSPTSDFDGSVIAKAEIEA